MSQPRSQLGALSVSVRVSLGCLTLLATLLPLLVSTGCSPDEPSSATDTAASQDTNAAGADAAADTSSAVDTGASSSDASEEDGAAADVGEDTQSSAATCAVVSDCIGKVALKSCQELACNDGLCGAAVKAGQCCEQLDCDDGQECTTDVCDTATNKCSNVVKVNCCSGKLTLATLGFDAGDWAEWSATVNAGGEGPGAVAWQVSDKRAKVGGKALYLGNNCGNYATAADPGNGCEVGADSKPVSATLVSKSYSLPADKDTHLHFWLWADVEPSYVGSLPPGTCPTPCSSGSTCVNVNGASQCIPEKDVLTVTVQTEGGVTKVFDSTSIGKSTGDAWTHVAVSLAAFAGKTVKVTWRFETGTGLDNAHEGIWLDEIVMETVCPVAGTLCDATTPCLDDQQVCTQDVCTSYVNGQGGGVCFHHKSDGCCTLASECDDGEPCTIDACVSGVCTSTPDASKPSCCKATTQLYDDFDSGVLTDWTLIDGNSANVQWRIDPTGGLQGSQALYFGAANFSSYQDPSLGQGVGPKGTACSKPTTLPVGTVFNQAVFQLQMQTEWSYLPSAQYKNPPLVGQAKFDHLLAAVLVDKTTTPIWSSDLIFGTTDGKWHEVVMSLVPWQGKTVQVCLSFDAGDDKVNDKKGIHVDNFAVRVACEQKSCYYDVDCAQQCGSCQVPGCLPDGCACVALPGCCTATSDCDDGDPCTDSQCVQGQCKHSKKQDCCKVDGDCASTKACDQAYCDLNTQQCATKAIDGCCVKNADCAPQDACSEASCDILKSKCVQTPKKGCCLKDADCDDKDPCTADTCEASKCVYKPSGKPGCS